MASTKVARCVITVVVWLLASASTAFAQESQGFASNGLYVGASNVPNFTLDGNTFDGSSYYRKVGGDEILVLPQLQRTSTLRAVAGYRLTRGSFEVGFERTKHGGTFAGIPFDATFQTFNFDERIYLFTGKRIQPYGLLGFSLPTLTVKDGSFLDERVGDGRFKGQGINIEPGVALFLHPHVGLSAGYRYRVMWFDTAEGVTQKQYVLRPRFRETAGSLSLSAFVTF